MVQVIVIGNALILVILMEPANPRPLNFTEKIKNFAYNFKYKAVAILEEYPLASALSPYQSAFLLGRQFKANPATVEEVNLQLATTFKDIIWITYRSGFPELLKDCGNESSFVTDTGWGCMIRVGQMLIAQILRDYLKPASKEDYTAICNHFNDFHYDATFSIQKIARLGKKQFNLLPGQWYNPAQIAYILSGFLNQSKNELLRNLKSIVFNNSTMFFDQLVQMFAPKGFCQCKQKPKKKQILCGRCHTTQRKVAVIILVRLGLDYPEPQYLEILNKIISWKWFRGLLGGKPQKALYFVGMKEDQYVYLDPHYVQTAQEDIAENKNSYFCQSFRRCKNTSIDPSLGICFYLESIQELNQYYRKMEEMKQNDKQFFIFTADETPAYLQKSKSLQVMMLEEEPRNSEEFQVIC